MLESIPPLKKKSLSDVFPMASPDALDLIARTLQFNPDRRLSGGRRAWSKGAVCDWWALWAAVWPCTRPRFGWRLVCVASGGSAASPVRSCVP